MNRPSGNERQHDHDLLISLLAEEGVDLAGAPRIPARARHAEHRLSFAQQRLWTLDQLFPRARSAYNIVLALRLSGVLDVDALTRSLNEIVRRHDVLRTGFASHLGEPRATILEAVTLPVPVIDLRRQTEPSQREALGQVLAQEQDHVFDLERAPLLRVTLLRLGDTEHVAVSSLHHLVADAWSMAVLTRELRLLYRAHLTGQPAALADLPIQYGDFAEWERTTWHEGRLVADLGYWTTQLAGVPSLELPAGRSALQRRTFAGDVRPFALSRTVTSALKQLGRQTGATLFMTVLAAFKVLLYRYTAQTDIAVGTPVANRNRREVEALIGFFVNTVVLRSHLSPERSFRSVLEDVRETALAAYATQDVPFDRIVHELALDRDAGPTPLFQVMFSLAVGGGEELELPGLSVCPLSVATTFAKFDLSLALTDTDAGLIGGFEYSTELFDADAIDRMAQHFAILLAAAVETPDRPIALLPMLPPREEQLVVLEWNQTARVYPSDASIVEVFQEQVERSFDKVALEFGDQTLTYEELDGRATQFADRLRSAGILDEECIGICVNPSIDMVVGLLGILKAGGVYVPLSPTDPPARIRSIVAEARVRLVATHDGLDAVLPRDLIEPVYLDRDSIAVGATRELTPRARIDGGRLAYIIYTSGSTGDPKGIAVPHRAVLRLVLNTNYVVVDASDRIAQASTFTFDAITFELWGALLNGACVVGVPRDIALSPTRLARFLATKHITTLFLTTALFNEIVESDANAFAPLRQLLFGGEAVDPVRVGEVLGSRGPTRLLHVYGPTETTTFATWHHVEMVPPGARTVPIGQPISNTEAYVLDSSLRPVAIGVPGELYLGGDGLARGYWAQPELTADKFRPHPFPQRSGERLYKTGDWVRRLPTGDIEFLGRIDQQVKIRGFRVELGDIEAALIRHPGVRQAVVRSDRQPGHHRLVAFVVPQPHANLTNASLLAHLRDLLPNYMIPAQIVHLDQLPMTAGGKIDRKRLPAPDSATVPAGVYEPPRSAEERMLAEVWTDLLGAARVGLADNFLELGGDSITAIQVASRLRRLGWELEPGDIIRRPTIAALARRLRRLSEGDDTRVVITGSVPLTPVQRWFFATHSGDLQHFNQSALLKPRERLDATALGRALQAVQEHHDALRMTYEVAADVSQRNEGVRHPLALDVVDLRGEPDQTGRLDAHATLLQASLDLRHGPLVKAALYRLDAEDRLLLVVHHLVIDLMSWRILLEDLETAYRQSLHDGNIDLGPKTDSYQLWAEEIERFSTLPDQLQEIEYWATQRPPLIPSHARASDGDETAPARESANLFATSAVVHTVVDEDDTRDLLTGVHHAYNTEVNDLMLTALARALEAWDGSRQTWITLEGHGREPLSRVLNLARTVGWFTSLFPFRLELRGDDPGTQLCEVKEALRRVPRKGVGYGILRYVTPPEHRGAVDFGHSPEISFNYAGQFDGNSGRGFFELAGEPCGVPVSPHLRRQHALDISSMVAAGRLEVSIIFDRERFQSEQVEQLLARFAAELRALASHCRQRSEGEKTPADFGTRTFSLESYRRFLKAYDWKASDIDDVYPLSPMQEGLLFQLLFDHTSDAYLIQTVCRIEGRLDLEAFSESWQRLSHRHASLRTAFVHDDLPQPLQVVFKERCPKIDIQDLRGLTPAEQAAHVSRCEASDRKSRFDLLRDALMRVTLLRLSESSSHLIWTYSHIVLDGWCVGILYNEFLQIYDALSNAKQPALPAAPLYRDYITWLHRVDVEAARRYWSSYLAGYERAVTPGRFALSRQPQPGEWRTRTFEVPLPIYVRARQLSTELAVTINTIVQTSWALVLSRYNDTRDIVFGTIVSGRPAELPGIEDTVGVFINAIPVRIRFERDRSVGELLQRVQRAALESDRWQHLPLAEILAQAAGGRSLFDHLLVFENYPVGREPLRTTASREPGLTVEFLAAQDRTHYDLDLVIVPGEPLQIQIGYTTASYDDHQIERTAAHLQQALASLTQDPAQSIDRVDILPDWERDAVLFRFNETDGPFRDDQTLVDMFEEHATRTPDAVALSYLDRSLTYAELSRRVDRLARRLTRHGVGPEGLVALHAERSLEMVVGMLAILRAGGAYLPLDSASPDERLRFILADAKPAFVLAGRRLSAELSTPARIIEFEEDASLDSPDEDKASFSRVGPDNLAYVVYTSGTTGRPKGVMVTHRSVANGACAWKRYYGLDTFSVRMLQMAPFSADVFTGDVVRCLTSGGALTICPADARADAASLYDLLAAQRISIFESTPALVVPLMDYIHDSGLDCSFLKLLIVGSDTLPAAQYRMLVERFGRGMRIVNSYGVTEATIESSCFELPDELRNTAVIADEAHRWRGPTPVGRPLLNTRYFVRDFDGRPSPIGFPGELHVGGEGVARGYLGREALTAERFIPDPVHAGQRVYKTGDLVRWLPDGTIEFIGRNDQQVKIRGYRIELNEIEHWLQQHPLVRDAVVGMKDYGDTDRELVAYIVPADVEDGDGVVSAREVRHTHLRRYLATRLPDYMVPRFIVELPALPLTAQGKVDRGALPDPEDERGGEGSEDLAADGRSDDDAPTSEPYRTLLAIWTEVLRVSTASEHDNFFQAGGHSLKAMQIVSRVHKHLGVRIAYRDFFEHPTFAGLAALVRAANPVSRPIDNVTRLGHEIEPRPPAADYALSHAQKRLWLLHHLEGHVAYNMPEAFVLEDTLDLEALERAFVTLLERHEALRTAFVLADGVPRQKILDGVPFAVRDVDVSGAADPEAQARQLAAAEAATPFDLTTPPLLRAVVFRLASRRHVFLLVIHHIIGDGWSMNVLYREILALYSSYRQGRPNPLPALRIQYKDYADWQNRRDFARDERYWLDRLAGVPARLPLPCDYSPGAQRDFAGRSEELPLGTAATANLRAVAAAHRTTVSNALLAVFQLVLYRWTGEPDVCVGLSIANRNHPDLENLIGFFVNVLPIRVRMSSDMEFGELLTQVAARTAEAFEYQDYPFDSLIEALNPERMAIQQPLVNVIYAFQNFQDVAIDIGVGETSAPAGDYVLPISAFAIPFNTSKFDLTLFVTDEGERLLLTLEYDTHLFRRETIRRCLAWIERFAGLVA